MKTPIAVAITAVVTALVVGAAAFYGGMVFGRNQLRSQVASRFGGNGANGILGGNAGRNAAGAPRRGGLATGTVLAVDATSITVKLAAGGSQTVYLAPSTRVIRSEDATASDLKTGEHVIVTGQTDAGGQVTARSIQIVPAGFQGAAGPIGFVGGQGGPQSGGTNSGTNGGGNQNQGGGPNVPFEGPPPGQ